MCDLIDLKSPDKKGLQNARLASPLIPVPTDIAGDNRNNRINDPIPLITGKRDSLENNPFDMVLHKTTEYIQKKDDPFEVTLEKALRPKWQTNNQLRTYSVDLTDDCCLKQKNHVQKLRMNRTLDEYSLNEKIYQKNVTTTKIFKENMTFVKPGDNLKVDNAKPNIKVEDTDLSILNQSVMNDTLYDIDNELDKNKEAPVSYTKATMQTEEDKVNLEQAMFLKIPQLRRSFSQGESVSPKKSQFLNHMSLVEPLRISSEGGGSFSPNLPDLLNEGFLKSYCSGSSMFSSLSNISAITKLNSISTINSSIFSNDTINRAFLDSCSSEKSEISKLNDNADLRKEVTNISSKCSTSMLTDRYNKLKVKVLELPDSFKEQNDEASTFPNDIKECVTVIKKDDDCYRDNKLVDVDVFTPEINSSKENCKNSISDTSSDSVFLEGSKLNKSILHEAKLLAKTFEELALKTSSDSSTDDFITNNPLWTSELLPAFDDDDVMVDNLIELPMSPNTDNAELKNTKIEGCKNKELRAEKATELANSNLVESIKGLELELIDPVHTEKHITAATLLLDLKKLIKTENNVEANKLVENLEKVLGVNRENNTELLSSCFNTTNNLSKSPQKLDNSMEIIENIEKNMEQSQDDNLSNDLTENITQSAVYKNMNYDDSEINKCANNQKYLDSISGESLKTNTEETENEKVERKVNVENESKEDSSELKTNLVNERVVVEILANIAKLLTDQNVKHQSLNILKNLGNILNSASNEDSLNKVTKTDGAIEIQQTPKRSKSKLEDKTHSSIPSKSINRQSLNLNSKKQSPGKQFVRRSMSVSQAPSSKGTPPLVNKNKSGSQLKEVIKRFPSDPSLDKIMKTNKNESQKGTQIKTLTALDLQKEKSTIISTVKSKLKKKTDTDVTNKRGPMKAILPIGTMQKRESVNTKIVSSTTTTPPKSNKITSSTPNSTNSGCSIKTTSRSSKPVASSTPDAESSKSRKIQLSITKKRNSTCDISPLTTSTKADNNNKINSSPRSKLSSPKKTTPKRRSVGSGIPRSQTPPLNRKLNSSLDINRYDKLHESPQRLSYRMSKSQKNSPVSAKKDANIQQSPLRDSNNVIYKVKPMKLISKLQRHSIDTNITEKENNYI